MLYLQRVPVLDHNVARLADAGQRAGQPLAVPLDEAGQVDVAPFMGSKHGPDAVLRIAAEDLADCGQQRSLSQERARRCRRRGWARAPATRQTNTRDHAQKLNPWSPRCPDLSMCVVPSWCLGSNRRSDRALRAASTCDDDDGDEGRYDETTTRGGLNENCAGLAELVGQL